MARARKDAAPPTVEEPWRRLGQSKATNQPKGEPEHSLCHTPGAYTCIDGWCVPELWPFYTSQAGVNGVEADWDGKRWNANPTEALQRLERRGVTVLPWNVDGKGSYLVQVGDTGTYMHKLQELVPGLGPLEAPPGAYALWLLELMEDGHLPKPHPAQVRVVRERLAQVAQTNANRDDNQRQAGELRDLLDKYDARAVARQLPALGDSKAKLSQWYPEPSNAG